MGRKAGRLSRDADLHVEHVSCREISGPPAGKSGRARWYLSLAVGSLIGPAEQSDRGYRPDEDERQRRIGSVVSTHGQSPALVVGCIQWGIKVD